ncbi:DNA mismatch repair protein MLH1-like [Hordeum vulgare subsp. vulgare]|uniref:DNA mismatch repair protein MLH1-like n=1 Tax=Hordeum vulgare subsp. vulgare TaxID=112509 RepID=UPI001D1A4ED0|nr:DNA mismatch repair protein MLH1-like [Hordeum vulgare subsp. vulgare]
MEVDDAVPRGGGGGGESPHIRQLEESVVNRIAAGKVIHRTSSAVQDLVEKTIDADSSTISVTIKDGSLKLIQVSDDGYAIRL